MKFDTDTFLLYGAIAIGAIIVLRTIPGIIGAAISSTSVQNITTPLCNNEQNGYHCYTGKNNFLDVNTQNVTQVSDTITITKDNGNTIPKNSWMVYIIGMETEDWEKGGVEAEIDLVPDNRDKTVLFIAVYREFSVYNFKLPPIVGHKYQRTIIHDTNKKTVTFILQDLTTVQQERFVYKAPNMTNARISFYSQGIEHWNTVEKSIFPDRFDVVTSQPVIS